MLDELALAIKELSAVDTSTLSDGELSDQQVELARLARQLEAVRVERARVWDARRVWCHDNSGARSAAAWLAAKTGDPKYECGSLLWLGRRLRAMPRIADAYAAGDVSAAHVRKLAHVHNPRTAADFARDEPQFVSWAQTLLFAEFTRALTYWWHHADPDGASQDAIDEADRRHVTLDETIDGTYAGSVLLDAVTGSIVWDELHRIETDLFAADFHAARDRLGCDPSPYELARTPGQRRADALVEMARRSATTPPDGRAPKPLFTVVLGADALRGLCELETGQAVHPTALVPWASDADIERILFDGTPNRVISVSRRRSFTGALRRLIQVRDRGCYHPTCDETAPHCQVDHIIPWTLGGITNQTNGRLACGHHNRSRPHSKRPPPRDDDGDD